MKAVRGFLRDHHRVRLARAQQKTQTGTGFTGKGPRQGRDTRAKSVSSRDGTERDYRHRGVSLDEAHLPQPLGEGDS